MKVVLGNPEVQSFLHGKIQKSIEYFPGKIHIITDGGDCAAPQVIEDQGNVEDSFTMSGSGNPADSFSMSSSGDPAVSYLNPLQMVNRLNKVTKKNPEEEK